jgi:hypothetical protein
LVLITFALVYGETMVRSWLGMYEKIFSYVADDFRLIKLTIALEGADRVIKATVIWKNIIVIGGKTIYPDPLGTAVSSTLMAHALHAPLLTILVGMVWPPMQMSANQSATERWVHMCLEYSIRALILTPVILLLVLFDIPLVLAGELWEMVFVTLDPSAVSAIVLFKIFMLSGGRIALALTVSSLCVVLASRLNSTLYLIVDSKRNS